MRGQCEAKPLPLIESAIVKKQGRCIRMSLLVYLEESISGFLKFSLVFDIGKP
jgi:hypothetical protein